MLILSKLAAWEAMNTFSLSWDPCVSSFRKSNSCSRENIVVVKVSAPEASNNLTVEAWPFTAAYVIGKSAFVVSINRFALHLSNRSTTVTWPNDAAICSAVSPFVDLWLTISNGNWELLLNNSQFFISKFTNVTSRREGFQFILISFTILWIQAKLLISWWQRTRHDWISFLSGCITVLIKMLHLMRLPWPFHPCP